MSNIKLKRMLGDLKEVHSCELNSELNHTFGEAGNGASGGTVILKA